MQQDPANCELHIICLMVDNFRGVHYYTVGWVLIASIYQLRIANFSTFRN